MSLYAEVRFKGIVKKEFRDYIEQCILKREWIETDDAVFSEYIQTRFSDNVFCDVDSYVHRWNETPFDPAFKKESGEWTFHLQFNTRWDGFDLFDDLLKLVIPYCIETIVFCQAWVEDETVSQFTTVYDLVNGELKRVGFVDEDGHYHCPDWSENKV